MILAVVPARGGSKRLPRKNVLPFGGRPLLAWSIQLANACPSVSQCVVSTDDVEIAAAAREAGAEIVARPAELAGDDSSITEVLVHAAETMQRAGHVFRGVLLLQPTNPLRPVDLVERAVGRFLTEPCDSLIAVTRSHYKLGRIVDGLFAPDYALGTPSRDMPPVFYENGLLYLTKADVLLNQRSLFGNRILAFETEAPFGSVDIDEPADLIVGEAVLAAVRDRLEYA